jgi:predicted aconitase
VRLSDADRAMLAGTEGAASQLAMRVIVKMAELAGAAELIGIASAHVDGCLFHGYAGLDFGEHVAWAESNAIVFVNSVLGARSGRYGDFIDIRAAITGRVPNAGLHLTERRRGQVVFDLRGLPDRLLGEDAFYPLLGVVVGAESGSLVPVVDGLASGMGEDRLKAVGAAAASAGGVALVHVVGSTSEAPTLADALQRHDPLRVVKVAPAMIRAAASTRRWSSTPTPAATRWPGSRPGAGSRSWRRPAILLAEPDEILVLGALVAEHLYGRTCPILVLPERAGGAIATGDPVEVSGDGTVTVTVA